MVVKTAVLKELETLYAKSGNQLCVLYGRPDLEKELLLKTFLQNKKAFYYRARYASPESQKQMMAEALEEKLQVRLQKYDYEEYFNRIKSGGPEKLILVIDEFSYIAKKDTDFINAVLKLKAKKLYPGPVMILLCSSVVSWVEKEMENCIGTDAVKKIDQTIKLSNLNFLEVVRVLPDYPVSECIRVYGVIGGVTGYINHWNPKVDLKTNICRQILSRNGYMYNKAENIIGASLRELSVYDTILACIAGGCDKLNDLYLKTGFSRAKISVYMKNLAASDIIEKAVSFETGGWENAKKGVYRIRDNYVNFWFRFIYPHLSALYMMSAEEFYDTYIEKAVSFETGGWENAKKGVYRIRDNYVNFWFRFIYPHLSALYMMSAEEFYDTYIEPGLNTYLNRYFVGVCMEYLWLLNLTGKLPLHIKKMGTWIGKTGNIDIIAQNEVRENLVGLCNWEKPQVTMEMCEELFANMKKAKISANYYFLFSASTFEQAVVEMAEQDKRFVLIDMSEL